MERRRYCNIKAKSLEQLVEACDRNIANIRKTHLDLLMEGDVTERDDFYVDMMDGILQDLREDIIELIQLRNQTGLSNP